jgi:5'-deoxynucleotidase YfbR-like HD superfamily hydrolase
MLSLRDRLRSRNVTRWHTVLTTYKQNIAEHSHCVGIIAEYILDELFKSKAIKADMTDRYALLKYAQVHDLPEVVTGDMSSVFKRFLAKKLPGFTTLMDEMECELVPELRDLQAVFDERPYLKVILKAADLLEAYSYFLVAKGLDEQHNTVVFEKLSCFVEECVTKGMECSPELDWPYLQIVQEEIRSGDSTVIDFETKLDAIGNTP